MNKKLGTTKDGWDVYEHYAVKGNHAISKCFDGDKVNYTLWSGDEAVSVHPSFDEAKPKRVTPKINEDWAALGKEYGILPGRGESWPKFKDRVKEKMQ